MLEGSQRRRGSMPAALHTHSCYSLLEGVSGPEVLLSRAAAGGYQAVALTDANNLLRAVAFADPAVRHGVRPLLGACPRRLRQPLPCPQPPAPANRYAAGSWGRTSRSARAPGQTWTSAPTKFGSARRPAARPRRRPARPGRRRRPGGPAARGLRRSAVAGGDPPASGR